MTFGERLQEALIDLICLERDIVTHVELGRRVAKRAGERKPVSQPNVSRWFQGSEPKRDSWRVALAAELGVRREWLFSGRGPKRDDSSDNAPPATPPAADPKVPPVQRRRGVVVRGGKRKREA